MVHLPGSSQETSVALSSQGHCRQDLNYISFAPGSQVWHHTHDIPLWGHLFHIHSVHTNIKKRSLQKVGGPLTQYNVRPQYLVKPLRMIWKSDNCSMLLVLRGNIFLVYKFYLSPFVLLLANWPTLPAPLWPKALDHLNCHKQALLLVPLVLFVFCFLRERGREGGREGEKHQCEKDRLVACCRYPKQQPRHVPWPGNEPATFCFAGQQPTEPH